MKKEFDTPQERLDFFISENFKTKKEFTDMMNVHPSWISSYTGSGKSIIRSQKVIDKLIAYGFDYDWYLGREKSIEIPKPEPEPVVFHKVDKIEFLQIPANEGKEYYFQPSSIFYEVTTQYARDNFKVVRLTGNDLSPVLTPDTLLIIDVNRPVKYGKYVVGTIADILVCRRYEYDANRKQDILTTNAQPYKIDNYSDFKLLGVVVEARITFL